MISARRRIPRVIELVRSPPFQQQSVRELQELVRFPSVSSDPQHAQDVRRCAHWLADRLRTMGMHNVHIVNTQRHPLIRAEWMNAPDRPTILLYGHYDVQPADPVGQWRSPPFAAARVGDDLVGRGASDDKGQLLAHLRALYACLHVERQLPVNVQCLFDGEEEIGSPSLAGYLAAQRKRLRADVAVISDTRMKAPNQPAITYGLRGALGFELEVVGQKSDLHSGNFGGAIHNPLQALCDLVAGLHDRQGRVTVRHFYDRVQTLTASQRAQTARVAPTDADLLRDAGAARGWGEPGFSLFERVTIRPAITINGLSGGYQGPGGKAVIPQRALAKISVRLAPDQCPQGKSMLRQHFQRALPPTMRASMRVHMRADPVIVERRTRLCRPQPARTGKRIGAPQYSYALAARSRSST